jgi:mono/diheme cytochrome c family protein
LIAKLSVFIGISAGIALASEVTFNRDVAPILYKRCVACHRPGDIAPMSLLTYKDARPWAAAIRESVLSRKMPPWKADPRYGHWSNDPRLSDAEIGVIRAWVEGAKQEGDPKDLPAPPISTTAGKSVSRIL